MEKVVTPYKILIITGIFIFSAIAAFGQDLGSSNGLFRPANPKSKTTATEKKSPPKPKTAKTTVRKSTPKRTPPKTSNTETASRKSKSKTSARKTSEKPLPPPPNKILITVGKPTSGDFNELFEQAIEEGNTARDLRNYLQAEQAYRRAQSLDAKDARAIYGLGNLYSDQQRWEEAEKAYRQAITLQPDNPEPFIAIGYVLTQPIVGMELSARYAEAEKMARKAIQLDPKNPFAFDQLGVALELGGNIGAETLGAYEKAIRLEPEFALAYAHLGRLLRRNGKIKESSEAYRKAMMYSNDVPTMILVADVLQSQQRYTDSELLLRRALSRDPKNPTALFLLGRALTTRAAFAEAETILKKSVEVSPGSFVSYVLLGSVYSRRGNFNDAEKTLNNALKVISENERKSLAREFETVGDGYLQNGKKSDALRAYRQAAALDNQKPGLNEKLARARM